METAHRDFLKAFSEAYATAIDLEKNAADRFTSAKLWTAWIMPVLEDAARTFAPEASVHPQWYTLDLVAVAPPCEDTRDYWKTRTVLAIEHENAYDVETEMWKLAHWKAQLSVLVFYDFNEADRKERLVTEDRTTIGVARSDWLTAKLILLSEIVRLIDLEGARRHLLLIGCRNSAGVIEWRFSWWSDDGFVPPTPVSTAMSAATYFAERAKRAKPGAFERVFGTDRPGGEPPRPGDEIE